MTTFNAGAIEASLALSRTSFSAELRKARAQADAFSKRKITPTIDLNMEGFAEAEAAIEALSAERITVPVDADAGAAEADLAGLLAIVDELDGREIDLSVDVDVALAEAELAGLEAEVSALDGRDIDINVDKDGSLSSTLEALAGGSSGGGGSMGLLKALIIACIALSPILAVSISSLAAVIVAFSAAVVGAAGALSIFVLAAFGAYQELQNFKDAGKELTPWMKFFEGGLHDVVKAWHQFIRLTDNDIFEVMGLALHVVADALPKLARVIGPVATVLIDMINGISDWVNGPGFGQFIKFFAGFGAAALANFGDILGSTFKILMRVFRAIAPFAIQMLHGLAGAMDDWVHGLHDLQNNKGFQDWLDSARKYGPMVLDMLGSLWDALINIGRAIAPFAGPMLMILTTFFDIIADADPGQLGQIISLLGGLWAAVSVGIPLVEGLAGALGLILSPAGLIVAAIVGIVAVLVYMFETNKRFHDQIIDLWNDIYGVIAPIVDDIVNYIMDHWDEISAYLEELWKSIEGVINGALYVISGYIERWLDVINFIWSHWGDQIMKVIGVVFKIAGDMIKGALQVIKGIFQVMGGILHGDWSKVWEGIKNILGGAVKGITAVIRGFGPLIVDLLRDGLSDLGGVVIDKGNDIVGFVKDIPNKIRDLADDFKHAGEHLITNLIDGLSHAPDFVLGFAGTVWDAVKDFINMAIDQINASLEFDIGFSAFGKDISHHVDPPDIPHLAKGGVATRPMLAQIAENGPEAVIPMSKLERMIDKASGSGIDYKQIQDAFLRALIAVTGDEGLASKIILQQTVNNPVAEPASRAGTDMLATVATVGIGS